MHVRDVEIVSEKLVGREGGFLAIRRFRLRNVRADGSRSEEYLCDFITRPKGTDAVVLCLWRRTAGGGVEVLLRSGLRPPVRLGRRGDEPLYFREVVAGILEAGDEGEAGVRRRAAIEAREEAGVTLDPGRVTLLGAGTFPSPGAFPETYWLAAAEVPPDAPWTEPPGDGSPMEEGARCEWVGLDQAIAGCVAGEIQDAKTELALRRLRDRLRAP